MPGCCVCTTPSRLRSKQSIWSVRMSGHTRASIHPHYLCAHLSICMPSKCSQQNAEQCDDVPALKTSSMLGSELAQCCHCECLGIGSEHLIVTVCAHQGARGA